MAVDRRVAPLHRGDRGDHPQHAGGAGADAVKAETFVLASGSASRQEMLRAASVPFEVVLPDVDEDAAKENLTRRGAGSAEIARALAELKAVAGSRLCPEALVLGADQVLDC